MKIGTAFNVCFDNWIRKDDWLKIISEIEQDLENIPDKKNLSLQLLLNG